MCFFSYLHTIIAFPKIYHERYHFQLHTNIAASIRYIYTAINLHNNSVIKSETYISEKRKIIHIWKGLEYIGEYYYALNCGIIIILKLLWYLLISSPYDLVK